jgi:hypothetical protein
MILDLYSPVLISNDTSTTTTRNSESLLPSPSAGSTTVDIKKEVNDTTATSAPPDGNELDKKKIDPLLKELIR